MQLVSSQCVILRSQDYLERDRLVTFLARDAGRLRGIVKGSRKLTSRGVGDFEPFSRGVIYYTGATQSGLVSIRKCDPVPPYLYLQGDYHKFVFAGYFAELIDLTPIEPGGAESYYVLLSETLDALCEPGPARRLPLLRLRFELHFLELLGYLPDWQRCVACGKPLFAASVDGQVDTLSAAPHQFDVREGGVRCPDCASADPHRLQLAAASLGFLENWRRGAGLSGQQSGQLSGQQSGQQTAQPTARPPVRPTRRALEELEAAVTAHLVHHLERKPRSLALLPPLDALDGAEPA